ncbi:hypothetical protein CTA2_9878 [Colletotrichum tanaceti]|uniref:Uncharacterized protein n=1 Tax=Colletotrichum tanaceti TaxID=1306861 RepID=A0A4U6XMG9_9PEZI|nr:hypothetical protein CTA2_9878 [Colletotrichum tanaceti]TKW56883.1 hypothetical protein CTA1_11289 [Colletotrichum tanaceti]
MENPTSELDNLSAILEWRCKEIWGIHEQGRRDEADAMAQKLLMEPRLSSLHQACMHLLLAASPHDYVHHAKEAVRLYSEVLQEFEHTPQQQANVEKMLDAAKSALREARRDQSAYDREVNKLISAGGKSMTDLHNGQLEALQRSKEQTQEEVGNDDLVSAAAPQSSRSAPTTAGVSRSTAAGRSQSTALTAMDDDTQPLPEIFR